VPELPEVETIRAQLAPIVEGRRLRRVEIVDPRWSRPLAPDQLAAALVGRRVESLGRRGKYLLWNLSDDVHLVQHLRMTGAVLLEPKPEPAHVSARLDFGARRRLVVVDPRRFGTGELLLGQKALEGFFATRLGVEPFEGEFTGEYLRAQARGRIGPIKSFLLDQRHVAGVGNIYADEALFRACVHPLRPAGRLRREQYEELRDAVVDALQAGVDAKGASIDDFRHVDGVQGAFQNEFLVHTRAGEPCVRCGTTIVKLVVGGRGTYVCERCQPRPRLRARKAGHGGEATGGTARRRR
jgi:formamidopyrimidine-DNA glycosylase